MIVNGLSCLLPKNLKGINGLVIESKCLMILNNPVITYFFILKTQMRYET